MPVQVSFVGSYHSVWFCGRLNRPELLPPMPNADPSGTCTRFMCALVSGIGLPRCHDGAATDRSIHSVLLSEAPPFWPPAIITLEEPSGPPGNCSPDGPLLRTV